MGINSAFKGLISLIIKIVHLIGLINGKLYSFLQTFLLLIGSRCDTERFNLLASEFYISILAHSVCKILITQEPKKVAL
jgi:hypothetical protein